MIPVTCDFIEARRLVLRSIEGGPPEVWLYVDEIDARIAFETLSAQWNECWLTKIVDGPGPDWRTQENGTKRFEAQLEDCARRTRDRK